MIQINPSSFELGFCGENPFNERACELRFDCVPDGPPDWLHAKAIVNVTAVQRNASFFIVMSCWLNGRNTEKLRVFEVPSGCYR